MSTFSERVASLRRERHLTVEGLAAAAGLDEGYLAKLEKGMSPARPPLRVLRALATALGVPTIELIALADPESSNSAGPEQEHGFFSRAGRLVRQNDEWREVSAALERQARRERG